MLEITKQITPTGMPPRIAGTAQLRAFGLAVLCLAALGLYAFFWGAPDGKEVLLKILAFGACALMVWAAVLVLFWERPAGKV